MVLNLEAILSVVRDEVERGESPPYIVCRVDFYATNEYASEVGRKINEKKAVRIREGVGQFVGMKYFSNISHYLLVDIRFEQMYPCKDIAELAYEMSKMHVKNYSSPLKTVLVQEDEGSAHIWAPLTADESKELCAGLELAVRLKTFK